ncbi:MAG: glycosyltransferase involved in cell wall biosynthesis [Akkermansiaceae bacterium]|jgi:glycosyltransferase involved in cell wall biosynthesis
MAHLNIIARSNGVGLDRDVDLIHQAAAAAGHKVTVSHSRGISVLAQWFGRKKTFDANLFLERIFPRWLASAKTNILIPNQERFPHRHLSRLKKIDHVFCKSQHALTIFSQLHPSCHFTGFTSANLDQSEIPRRPGGILHLAGRSTLKGTETVLNLWKKHPEWPTLTLLQHKDNAPTEVPDNVHLIAAYLSQEEIIKLVNAHPIHLCPSLSEGWGHYIVEAMSCGATVITTDGPPMNELVHPDRGILVAVSETEPRHLGTNFKVDPAALESAITEALSMSEENRTSIQSNAKTWALENHRNFEQRFTIALAEIT